MSPESISSELPGERRDWDCWLICAVVLSIYLVLLNRSLPEGVAAILERASAGDWQLGPHVGFQLILVAAYPLAELSGASLALLAAGLSAIAVTAGTALSFHVFRSLRMSRSGIALAALMIATCPPVLFAATVAGPQGILFLLLSSATLATVRLGRTGSRGWTAVLLASLGAGIAVDPAAVITPLALAVTWLITTEKSIAQRGERMLLSLFLATIAGIAIATPRLGGLLLSDWLRGLFPLSWVVVYCLFRLRTRFLSAAILIGVVSATSASTEGAVLHEGIRLLPFLWPAIWLANVAFHSAGLRIALVCVGMAFGVARVKLFDVSLEAASYAEGLRETGLEHAGLEQRRPFLIFGSEAEHALLRLQGPSFEQTSIDGLIQFLERVAEREILGGSVEATLEERITRYLESGSQVFLTRSAEDLLRDPAFRIRHHVAVRALNLLRSRFAWTTIDRGAFLAQELSLLPAGK